MRCSPQTLDATDYRRLFLAAVAGLVLSMTMPVPALHADELESPFSLDQYRWKNRVIVVSAETSDDLQLDTFRKALAESRAEFEDRDLVLVTLLSKGDSIAGDRLLTGDEVATLRERLRAASDAFAIRLVGKDGTVKLSQDSVVPAEDIYALIDTMPMRQNEVSGR